MKWLNKVLYIFQLVTGIIGRHNLALRDVSEWSSSIEAFLQTYNLLETDTGIGPILDDHGKAQFELVALTHKAHQINKISQNIKGARISPLTFDMAENLDGVRRALINPSLSQPILVEALTQTRASFSRMKDALSEIEYK